MTKFNVNARANFQGTTVNKDSDMNRRQIDFFDVVECVFACGLCFIYFFTSLWFLSKGHLPCSWWTIEIRISREIDSFDWVSSAPQCDTWLETPFNFHIIKMINRLPQSLMFIFCVDFLSSNRLVVFLCASKIKTFMLIASNVPPAVHRWRTKAISI